MPDESLFLELCERGELLVERPRLGETESPDPQVDDVEGVEAEPVQIVVDGLFELLRRASVEPATGLRRDGPRPWSRCAGSPDTGAELP